MGSKTLASRIDNALSPATIRHIMAVLEEKGLLHSPHTSAGRLPTIEGLRLFVKELLELDPLDATDKDNISSIGQNPHFAPTQVLEETISKLSELSQCVSLVFCPAVGTTPTGQNLEAMKTKILEELSDARLQLSNLAREVIGAGLAALEQESEGQLIIKGQSKLLRDAGKIKDLSRLGKLLEDLETKSSLLELLDLVVTQSSGVQTFIGDDSPAELLADCSMVVAPYRNESYHITGVVGVIGPIRLKYDRIIPMVEYTAEVISELN